MARRTNVPEQSSIFIEDISYLSTKDVPQEGLKLTIVRVEEALVGQEQKLKKLVHFANDGRVLVLNKVNNACIDKVSQDTNEGKWEGCEIELYPTTIEWNDVETPCIRVRLTISGKTKRKK